MAPRAEHLGTAGLAVGASVGLGGCPSLPFLFALAIAPARPALALALAHAHRAAHDDRRRTAPGAPGLSGPESVYSSSENLVRVGSQLSGIPSSELFSI